MALLLKRIDEMVGLAEHTKRPFVMRVPDRGKIESF